MYGGFDVPLDSTVFTISRKTAVFCKKNHENISLKVRNIVYY